MKQLSIEEKNSINHKLMIMAYRALVRIYESSTNSASDLKIQSLETIREMDKIISNLQ